MLLAGLYVPEQEVAGEGGEGDRWGPLCDAKLCFSPEETSRAHHTTDGPWQILRCEACRLKVRKN